MIICIAFVFLEHRGFLFPVNFPLNGIKKIAKNLQCVYPKDIRFPANEENGIRTSSLSFTVFRDFGKRNSNFYFRFLSFVFLRHWKTEFDLLFLFFVPVLQLWKCINKKWQARATPSRVFKYGFFLRPLLPLCICSGFGRFWWNLVFNSRLR